MKTTNNIDAVLSLSARILTLRSELQPWRDRLTELSGLETELRILLDPSAALPLPSVLVKRQRPGDNGKRIMQVLRDSEEALTYAEIHRRSHTPASSCHFFLKKSVKDGFVLQTGIGTYTIKNRDKSPVAVLKSLE